MKKTNLATALASVTLLLSQQAWADSSLPAALPEFKDQAQMTQWTSEQTPQTANAGKATTTFYTGKPYVADAGGYVYKYRTYNPEMSRWTSADPSGFPDGVNNQIYAGVPENSLDSDGLFTTIVANSSSAQQTFSGSTFGTNIMGVPITSYTTEATATLNTNISTSPGSKTVNGSVDALGETDGVSASGTQTNYSSTASNPYLWTLSLNTTTGYITVSPVGGMTSTGNGGLNQTDMPSIAGNGTSSATITWNVQATGLGTAGGSVSLTFTAE